MFNIAFQAADAASAKTELHQRSDAQETPVPGDMLDAIERCIDAVGGTGTFGVGCYGSDGQLNLSIQRLPE